MALTPAIKAEHPDIQLPTQLGRNIRQRRVCPESISNCLVFFGATSISENTHAWALGLCCLVCLGCIPYLMNSLKDVQHKCGRCGVLLATWHRGGTTEVHIRS
ncbi:hypothetical protein BU16DRAFT_190012 [Lophium mytilinum]|uniref:LITAF domain-containing protein n=1 Tax=Lophium mytilinum TaxID=390894 RepID=A0A6A6R8E1_9PEZI|nr:hypothetical protein BU16DRAFT_190012 [Lophium mytilinum]